MKKHVLFMCIVLAACLVAGCDQDKITQETTEETTMVETTEEVTTTTNMPSPTPTPTPTVVPINVEEVYTHKNNGDTVLTSLVKIQNDEIIYRAEYFQSGKGIQREEINSYDDYGKLIHQTKNVTLKTDDYRTTRSELDYTYGLNGELQMIIETQYEVVPETEEMIELMAFKYDYLYNDSGECVCVSCSNADTSKTIDIKFSDYDDNGRLISDDAMNFDESTRIVDTYEYDDNDNVIVHTSVTDDEQGSTTNKTLYTYEGDLLIRELYYQGDKLIYDTSYRYDENGHMIYSENTSYDHAHGGSDVYKCYWEYDDEGRVIKSGDLDNPDSYREYVYSVED